MLRIITLTMPRTAKPHEDRADLDLSTTRASPPPRSGPRAPSTRRPSDRSAARSWSNRDGRARSAIGTASWTDPTITKGGVFYPRGVVVERGSAPLLREPVLHVEVDSTYYSLPERAIARSGPSARRTTSCST
jgi:hypothetical protein